MILWTHVQVDVNERWMCFCVYLLVSRPLYPLSLCICTPPFIQSALRCTTVARSQNLKMQIYIDIKTQNTQYIHTYTVGLFPLWKCEDIIRIFWNRVASYTNILPLDLTQNPSVLHINMAQKPSTYINEQSMSLVNKTHRCDSLALIMCDETLRVRWCVRKACDVGGVENESRWTLKKTQRHKSFLKHQNTQTRDFESSFERMTGCWCETFHLSVCL